MLSTEFKGALDNIMAANVDVAQLTADFTTELNEDIHELQLDLLEQELSNDHFRSDEYLKKSAADKMTDIWS